MTTDSPLILKMRALAATAAISEEDSQKLRDRARELEGALAAIDAEGGAKKMLGAYARARLLYCDLTGEPLV